MSRLLLGLAALSVVCPLIWILLASLRPSPEVFLNPLGWPDHWTLSNYKTALALGGFTSYFANSLWITLASTLLTTFLGASLAFCLARFRLPGHSLTQGLLATGLVLPLQLVVLPLFFWLKGLGLLGTESGLILVYTASGIPYAVLLLRGFFSSLPQELFEAAQLDGCTPRRAFREIFLPLARPGLSTVALFTAVSIYNEYFLAFILLGQGTLPLGLANLTIVSQYHGDFGQLYAGLVLAMLPSVLLYATLHRHILTGLAQGAVKG
ncbi:carbohydrate ABC transporter permease [bacterium]|nr:carbohydrate ABC transporter permease [bacterium]